MPYTLSDDERLIRKVVREFARDGIGVEAAQEMDRHDRFPEGPLEQAAALGLFGMGLSEEEGGSGAGATAMVLALDEVAQVCPSTAAVLGAHNGLSLRILRHGDGGLLRQAAGGALVATLATEEASGSDKGRIGTVAEPSGDGHRISGQKVWGLGAAGAGHLLVLASVPEGGPTWFVVPVGADGVVLGRNEPLLGLRGAGVRTVYLSGVEVPAEARVGPVGDGVGIYREALPWHQVATAAALNGCLAGALEAAARFAEERVQFGRPIGSFQAVSGSLTEIDLRLAATRALTREAAAALGGDGGAVAGARAKEAAAEAAVWLTRTAIRVQGGTGFMRESGTERLARDARVLQFVAEPSVVQREVLKRSLLDIDFGPAP